MKYSEAKKLKWGTRGKSGRENPVFRTLGDLTSSHLLNILITQHQITYEYKMAIKKIILKRIKK